MFTYKFGNPANWAMRRSDFSQQGWHAKPSVAYSLMIRALRLSPSYELARKFRVGEITNSERKNLPKDFAQVLATYDLIGNVDEFIFRPWWIAGGIKVFGIPYSKNDITVLENLEAGEQIDFENICKNIKVNFIEDRINQGLPATLLLSLPLTLKKTAILNRVRGLIRQVDLTPPNFQTQPLIQISGRRLHLDKIADALNLMTLRALHHETELWRLGAQAEISKTYSTVLDYKAPRKPKDDIEVNDRIILGKITYRLIKRYELIIENAARGKFICDDKLDYLPFDYAALGQKYKNYQKWLRNSTEKVVKKIVRHKD